MSGGEIALLVGVCVAFVVAVGIMIYNKLKGKGGCDCGCGSCGDKHDGKSACDGCCSHCLSVTAKKQDDEPRN